MTDLTQSRVVLTFRVKRGKSRDFVYIVCLHVTDNFGGTLGGENLKTLVQGNLVETPFDNTGTGDITTQKCIY